MGQLFRDVTAAAGITFRRHSAPEKKYIVESMSGGVALFDYDRDGRLDIYLVDSLTVDTADQPEAAHSGLYRNLGAMRFTDVASEAGVAHPGWAMGVCAADVDGDGWQDLYVTNLGPDRMYRNQRDGTFDDVAGEAGIAADGWSTGCGFADYDRDGDLDLFVSRYVELDLGSLPRFGEGRSCMYRGVAVQCGPRGLVGTGDLLFRNDGAWRFTDVSEAAGVSDPRGYFGLGVAWLDYDRDGWLDLYVANDSNPNFLYRNLGDGRFDEVAFPAGVAVSEDGAEQGGMGVAIGDIGGQGAFSIFVTNFSEEYNNLFRNDGEYFTDVSFPSRTAASSLPYVGWGAAFLDFDNDGDTDIIVANGHVYPQLETATLHASAGYRQRRLLYRNLGDGSWEESAERFGPPLLEERVSRGLAIGDLDDDGRLDVVINDLDGGPQLLQNVWDDPGHWLTVELRGRPPNTSAVGALVSVFAEGRRQTRLVQSGSSYLSQSDVRVHFGLGDQTRVERMEVLWPDGSMTRRERVRADQIVEIEQE